MNRFSLGESDLSPQESAAWYDVNAKFRALSAQFEQARHRLMNEPPPPDPALAAERLALLSRSQSVGNTVSQIRSALDDVTAALSGAWDQVTGAWDWIADRIGIPRTEEPQSLQGLGLPIIPIAAVLAALAVITAFLTDYASFQRRADLFREAVAAGSSPEQASAIVARMAESGGLLSTFGASVPWLGIGAIAALLIVMHSRSQR